MTVNRYATQAGKRYQRELMQYLRDDLGYDAENLVLTGKEDEGDVLLRTYAYTGHDPRFVLEAKREKGFNLASWIGQAERERDNYVKHRGLVDDVPVGFAVVSKRRSHGIGKSYVITTLDEWLRQIT